MAERERSGSRNFDTADDSFAVSAPTISLPKGGGAIRGIGEKFAANPATGTGSMTVPIHASSGRGGFGPHLSLSYDSGYGNGPFGFGWSLSLPAITRKTDKGLPRYEDAEESDVFILSGVEDLTPALLKDGGGWTRDVVASRTMFGRQYAIQRYRPRIEGLFARIERWVDLGDGATTFWRSITKDNITSWYGRSSKSRIADPSDASRIYSWMICESYDDKGNVVSYRYKREDSTGVDRSAPQERNRTDASRSAQRYLKCVLYGNRTPYFPDLNAAAPASLPADWCFELVFDYGEHDLQNPVPDDAGQPWACRLDPFSTYRPTFELRTYRLCRRAMMFHHFAEEPGVGLNCLVRSTDLVHASAPPADPAEPFYAHLLSITQTGHVRLGTGYLSRSLPPLEFAYTVATVDDTVRDVDPESLENLPEGVDGTGYRWVDLDGEGVSGFLSEQGANWFYKPNFSPANRQIVGGRELTLPRFGPAELVARRPSIAALNRGGQQLMDLSGNGCLDLVEFDGPAPGYYERTPRRSWQPYRPFPKLPVIDWRDANLRFVDLTGDGFPDLLLSEDGAFWWHPSLATEGFGPGRHIVPAFDEEKGPALVFADETESIFFADMSGDGLADLVRIRRAEVCYWPNLGYGRFGTKVTMDGSPQLDSADLFDGARVRLADIDGSGTADLVYFGRERISLYFNQSGNAWGAERALDHFPAVDGVSSAAALDLLGAGTSCLVWSSPLPGNVRRPMRYIDLMGGRKPHLLERIANNLGMETVVRYAPSTKFYIADKLAGTPWVTRLPFPVQVVEQLETYDYVSRNLFISRYTYHHGYFDGVEREFRGFGRVEQWDTAQFGSLTTSGEWLAPANIDAASHVPPVLTVTWYHTGAFFGQRRISRHLTHEYYAEGDASGGMPGLTAAQRDAMLLDDTILPTTAFLPDGSRVPFDLSPEEMREAARALRGSVLREEVYGRDASGAEDRPYSVRETNYTIEMLQPQGPNCFGVFFVHPRESISFWYDRNLYKVSGNTLADPAAPPPARIAADPRVAHDLTFAVDPYGNVLRTASVNYRRRYLDPRLDPGDQAKQSATLAAFSLRSVTNAILEDDSYRVPAPAEVSSYALIQASPKAALADITNLFAFDELDGILKAASDGAHEVLYEDLQPAGLNRGEPYRRLLLCSRTCYRPDDFGASAGDVRALLPLGRMESLGLPGVMYQLATTNTLIAKAYQRSGAPLLPAPAGLLLSTAGDGGGYVDLDGDGRYWAQSNRLFYAAGIPTPLAESAQAKAGFFLPRRFEDPFGQASGVDYDAHRLLPVRTSDEKGNAVTAVHDYRVLQPALITDANANQSQVAFDALGLVVATAVMGKSGEHRGDLLTGFSADLSRTEIDGFYDAADPATVAAPLIGQASRRVVYDVNRFYRTRLDAPDDPSKWLPAFSSVLARETHVSDLAGGASSAIQVSFSYADAYGREILKKVQAEPGPVVDGGPAVDPRWVGSGWTIYNNKDDPVRRYEPYFSRLTKGHQFEFAVTAGVSAILGYDAAERVVAKIYPDHSYEKVVFDPWWQASWDANDNVLQDDPTLDPDVGDFFRRLPAADYAPSWKAQRDGGAMGTDEQAAAAKTALHAATPRLAFFDPKGRNIVTVEDNGPAGTYTSRAELDIQGNVVAASDPLGRVVMTSAYDMSGRRIHQASMDAGERWLLADAVGKSIRGWDSRGHNLRSQYDELRRPTALFVRGTDAANSDPRSLSSEVMFEKTEYGEGQASDQALNLRTRIFRRSDAAGIVSNVFTDPATGTNVAFDFKGNTLGNVRQFVRDYKILPNWAAPAPALMAEQHVSTLRYDALNRIIAARAPDGTIARPTYNKASLLEQLEANLKGAATATRFVGNIDYDAKGQRRSIAYGSRTAPIAITTFAYDPLTFRLQSQITARPGFPAAAQTVQALTFTYDPSAHLTHVADDAQQTVFFNNRRVEPSTDYTYDAIYRLTTAIGREQLGLAAGAVSPPWPTSYNDVPRTNLPHPGDGNAMGTYRETYTYDDAGNLRSLVHAGSDPANAGWTRSYTYGEASLIEAGEFGNHLTKTAVLGSATWDEPYGHDRHGNITRMPQLQLAQWDFRDQLIVSQRQAVNTNDADGVQHQGERTYYTYNAAGERVRKVTETAAGVKAKERLYLGTLEIYREYNGGGATTLERQTLNVTDDSRRIALVETRTGGASAIRFQLTNLIGSSCLELDDTGAVITYEEYYPYGSTSYQGGRSVAETSLKRYRFTGKERDEETGLEYHGARYLAPWLGRWISADPKGLAAGMNPYAYCRGDPVSRHDPTGTQDGPTSGVGVTISANGIKVGPISVQGPGSTAPLAPLPSQTSNSPEDLAHFIWIQSRFIQGMPNGRTPQKVGQDAHSTATTVVNDLKNRPSAERLPDVDRVYSEVRVENGTVTQIGGKPGGPKGALNPDLVVVQKGTTLNVGDTDIAQKSEVVTDFKAGSGTIANKYGVLGGRQVTENGITNSADTDPRLLQPTQRTGTVNMSPRDADVDAASGKVVPGPNTSAAMQRRTGQPPDPQPAPPVTGGGNRGLSPAGAATTGVLGGLGRAVPYVAEGEAALMGLAGAAALHSATVGLTAPLMTAAEALPVAAGVGVVGAGTGHLVRAGLEKAGVDPDTATGIGLGAAVATGAALGSFIPGVGTAAGAVIGGVVAGLFYLFSL